MVTTDDNISKATHVGDTLITLDHFGSPPMVYKSSHITCDAKNDQHVLDLHKETILIDSHMVN